MAATATAAAVVVVVVASGNKSYKTVFLFETCNATFVSVKAVLNTDRHQRHRCRVPSHGRMVVPMDGPSAHWILLCAFICIISVNYVTPCSHINNSKCGYCSAQHSAAKHWPGQAACFSKPQKKNEPNTQIHMFGRTWNIKKKKSVHNLYFASYKTIFYSPA